MNRGAGERIAAPRGESPRVTQTQRSFSHPSPEPDPELYPADRPSTGLGTGVASFVCSMVGISPAAIALGHVSRSQSRRAGVRPFAWSRWGLFFGYLQLVTGVALAVLLLVIAPDLLKGAGSAGMSLRSASAAEAANLQRTGTYTASVPALVRSGFKAQPGVTFTVVRADRTSYCLKAVDGGTVLYASSYHDDVTSKPCL